MLSKVPKKIVKTPIKKRLLRQFNFSETCYDKSQEVLHITKKKVFLEEYTYIN